MTPLIVYNHKVFSEDPLFKFHFEDYHTNNNLVLHLGFNESNLIRYGSEKHVLMELEQPNRYMHPKSHESTFICEKFYDKILTINPNFVRNRNMMLGCEKYIYVFFPFSSRYIPTDFTKDNNIIYTGNLDYFDMCTKLADKGLIWVGSNGNRVGISYLDKLELTKNTKIALSHSIIDFKDVTEHLDKHIDTVKHADGIIEQHKARTIEAAFNKAIIIHLNTGEKIIENFFVEGEDFLYYKEGLIDDILANYEKYEYLAENAFNKAVNNYTTEHFYITYIKPLL